MATTNNVPVDLPITKEIGEASAEANIPNGLLEELFNGQPIVEPKKK